jgi:hypothetical protein
LTSLTGGADLFTQLRPGMKPINMRKPNELSAKIRLKKENKG